MPVTAPPHRRELRRLIIERARQGQKPGSGSGILTPGRKALVMWPDPSQILADLPWAVAGGVATRLYMPERSTTDLDIVVLESDFQEARRRLEAAGYRYQGVLATGGGKFMSQDGVQLDVLAGSESWWEPGLREARRNRDQQGLPILPMGYLVLVKMLSKRAQDTADVSRILAVASESDVAAAREIVANNAPDELEDFDSLRELGLLELQDPREITR